MIMHINNFDFIIMLTVGISGAKGLYKGFSKSIIWIIGIICSIYAIMHYKNEIALELAPYIDQQWARTVLASTIIVIIIMLISALVSKALKKCINLIGLGIFDHILGLILGCIRGALIIALAIKPILASNSATKILEVKQSKSWPTMKKIVGQK